jgi:hypothetical protein
MEMDERIKNLEETLKQMENKFDLRFKRYNTIIKKVVKDIKMGNEFNMDELDALLEDIEAPETEVKDEPETEIETTKKRKPKTKLEKTMNLLLTILYLASWVMWMIITIVMILIMSGATLK